MKTPAKTKSEYRQQREKNNVAVRRSREKSKQKIQETKERVDALKKQNVELTNQIELLNRELSFLKELFNAKFSNKDTRTCKELKEASTCSEDDNELLNDLATIDNLFSLTPLLSSGFSR